MPDIKSTTESGAARAARVPLWVLIAIFLAGIALLSVIQPAAAHAQTAADSTVLLNWTAPGDDGTVGRATTYDIRYRTVAIAGTDTTTWWNAATQVTGEPAPGTAGASDSMRVRGLSPLTTYYFMIRAADEVPNWSGYSNVAVRATSGDATPPATIADLSVTGTTGTSISVRWTAPGDDGTTGTAASYDVRYSTSTITSANWSSALQATGEPAPAAAGTSQTFTIGGLSGSRTYYVAIKTTDDAGNVSVVSNVVNGTTSDTVAPAPVRDLSRTDALPDSEMLALADTGDAADLP
ncbi:MAG TPA: fibronectin type III domain-containing protein [Candidatus Eisenbacteria bacterium]|nr:fibronectin type III domain-containing protein [Candidatus Eisenbacteria bacterium]